MGNLVACKTGLVVLLFAGLMPSQARAAVTTEWRIVERWAGHQVVSGRKDLSVLGEVETRTESFLIADVSRRGDDYRLTQYTCRVAMSPVNGVQAKIADRAVRSLPPATIEFSSRPGGQFSPSRWNTGWGVADYDRDGRQGLTVTVDAPLCGGALYISSTTQTDAQWEAYDAGLEANLEVSVEQDILDTSNWCLDLATSDTTETVVGKVRYLPVSKESTCDRLFSSGWPVLVPTEPRMMSN